MAITTEELIFIADTKGLNSANDALDNVVKKSRAAESAAGGTRNMFRSMRSTTQQLGYQLQDVSVQLQSGTNKMIIMGQQGSQIASLFGPGGAIVGAFIAAGAAIYTAMDTGEKATSDLEDAMKSLHERVSINDKGILEYTDRIRDMAEVSRQAAQLELKIALEQAKIAAEAASTAIGASLKDSFEAIIDLNEKLNSGVRERGLPVLRNKVEQLRKELGLSHADMSEFSQAINDYIANPSLEAGRAVAELGIKADLSNSSMREFFINLLTNVSTMNQAKTAMEELKKVLIDMPETFDNNAEAVERLRQANEKAFLTSLQKQVDKEAMAVAERKRLKDEQRQMLMDELGTYSSHFSKLGSLMSSHSVKAFKIGQKAALASAIVSGISSAIESYEEGAKIGGPYVGAAFAAISGAATGAMIAQIKSQKPPGRALGGTVNAGGMYMVGEHGPELLQMGTMAGRINPNIPAANSPVNVVNNVKVVGGNGQQPQVTSTSRQIDGKIVSDIVVNLMADPSSRARTALHRTSNVVPRGSI